MFGKIKVIFEAIKAGKSLQNPEAWKKVQITASIIGGLLLSVSTLFPSFAITPEQINMISLAIANIGGTAIGDVALTQEGVTDVIAGIGALITVVLVPYWTVATTKKVGLPPVGPTDTTKAGPTAKIPGH